MPGNPLARLLVVTLGVWGSACSTPSAPLSAPTAPTSAPTASPPASIALSVKRADACIVSRPAAWETAFARVTALPEGTRFGLGSPAVVGPTVYGQINTADSSGIARLDLGSGRLEELVRFGADVSGTASIAVSPPWLAWTQGNSTRNLFDWTVYARNLESGETLTLATSRRPDGAFLPGQQPVLSLRASQLAWSQTLPGPGPQLGSELHVFDLAARRDKVLTTGRVSAPVFSGRLLIWGERNPGGAYSFAAVEALTLAPAPLPEALRVPGSIVFLAGAKDWFAWSAEGLMELNVWRFDANERRQYRAPDIRHYFQFMQLAGGYLLWYSGVGSAILDLESGALVDVSGSLAGGDDLIVMEQPSRPPAKKGEIVASRVSAARPSGLPGLGECRRS